MIVSVFLEQRFDQMPDGSLWVKGSFTRSFWLRYLSVFDKVRIVARVKPVAQPDQEHQRADGENITYFALPYYLGPRQYLANASRVRQAVRHAIQTSEAVIFRAPSAVTASAVPILQQRQQPYGVEVIGNPYDVFAPSGIQHPLRLFFRWWFTRQLEKTCQRADAIAYVTEKTLQSRFQPPATVFTTFYSSVELPDDAFVATPRQFSQPMTSTQLVTVGSLEQLYKGTDLLLRAIRICKDQGLHLRLSVVGDGKHRTDLQTLTTDLDITDRVQFVGHVPSGAPVREFLDTAHLFVLPSRTEGLPRAMIEAMARGLPCVGSTVGGIPELLPPEDMMPPGDAAALANKIGEIVGDTNRMTLMSSRNLTKAAQYREVALRVKRNTFYAHVQNQTRDWLNRGN